MLTYGIFALIAPRWPQFDYIELWVKPTSGKICSECEGKRLQGDCCPDTSPTLYKEG
jgi:hypothetical protein